MNDVSWSPGAHCVAVAAGGGGKPLRVAGYAEGRGDATPPPRPRRDELLAPLSGAELAARLKQQRAEAGFSSEQRPRPVLPPRLTPDAVREMLRRARVDSARREGGGAGRRQETSVVRRGVGIRRGVAAPASASTRFAAYQAQAASARKEKGEKENVERGKVAFDPYAAGRGEGATHAPGGFGLAKEGF